MLLDKVTELFRPVVEDLGYIFWGVDVIPQAKSGPIVRLYIDYEEGIGIEDCQKVSRSLSSLLEVEDIIIEAYTLEVSSPGSDRKIFNVLQAKSVVDFKVKVKLIVAVDNARNFKGTIDSVDLEKNLVTIKLIEKYNDEDRFVKFDFDNVDKMSILPIWEDKKKKKGSKK